MTIFYKLKFGFQPQLQTKESVIIRYHPTMSQKLNFMLNKGTIALIRVQFKNWGQLSEMKY